MLTRAAVAILSLYVLYVAAINVFLSTSLFRRLVDGDPDRLFVSFERGWSIWPGTVHARNLTIRASDNQVEWLIRLETCSFDVSFLDLARKTVHFEHPRATGVIFQLRERLAAPAATPEYVDALPPIPGFARIPLKTQEPPDLQERWDDRHYKLWSIKLSDAVAEDVRQVWVDSVRVDGSARIAGGFYVKPIRKAQVGPAHLETRDARISVKDRVVAEAVTGSLDFELEPFDPRTVTGQDLLKRVTATTELRGRSPELGNLPRSLHGPLVLSGPVDVPRLALRIEKGKVMKSTHADLVATGVRVEAAAHRFAGNVTFAADASGAPGPTSLVVRVLGRGLTVGRVEPDGNEAGLARVAALDIAGALDEPMLDLSEPRLAWGAEVHVPDVELVDHELLGRFLPPGKAPEIARGHEHLDVHATSMMVGKLAAGSIDVHAGDLGLVLAPVALSTDVRAHLGVHDWAIDEGTLVVDEASVTTANTELRHARAAASALTVERAFARASSERFTLSDPLARLDLAGAIEGGRLLDSSVLDTFFAKGSDVTVDAVRGAGRFAASLRAGVDDHVAHGSASVHTHAVGVRTPELRVRGELDANATVSAWSLDDKRMRGVTARARLDDVAVELRKTSPGGLAKGRADVRSRSVELRANAADVDLSPASLGNVDYRLIVGDTEMDDASKLGALLSTGKPSELVIESGKVHATADIAVSPSRKTASGGAKLVVGGAGVRLEKTRMRGNLDLDLRVTGLAPGSRDRVDIAGSRIALRHVETVGAAAETKAWNGDVVLLRGVVQVSDRPGLDAITELRADDASPILALTIQDRVPGFVVGPLKAPGLDARARIVVEQGRAAILDGRMQGDNVVVAGDYVSRTEHMRGAFTVAKGAFSAGVKLDDAGATPVFFDLEPWRAREKQAVLALFVAPPSPPSRVPAPAQTAPAGPAPGVDASKAKAKAAPPR